MYHCTVLYIILELLETLVYAITAISNIEYLFSSICADRNIATYKTEYFKAVITSSRKVPGSTHNLAESITNNSF